MSSSLDEVDCSSSATALFDPVPTFTDLSETGVEAREVLALPRPPEPLPPGGLLGVFDPEPPGGLGPDLDFFFVSLTCKS